MKRHLDPLTILLAAAAVGIIIGICAAVFVFGIYPPELPPVPALP